MMESNEEMILVSKASGVTRGRQAPGQKAHDELHMGQQARGHDASQTLGLALSSRIRQPKPRKMGSIDELLWSEAQMKAAEEMKGKFNLVVALDEYYKTMCSVG